MTRFRESFPFWQTFDGFFYKIQILNLLALAKIKHSIGRLSVVVSGQILRKINLAIWSHWTFLKSSLPSSILSRVRCRYSPGKSN